MIGTHRVLSKDIGFKDLGLLIIDEEQRFGVTHKEKIKKLRENIDVLTLTATPIPRTLHMSLIGIRDMSVLEEAPQDRMPIQTYVMEYNDEMVREAIERELSRGGQVYYVYNRVNDIADVAGHLQQLIPTANISFAHGQMRERELEDIMYDFINGDIDVLVSTTIIETGLDIPNANTLIIEGAERMGLSQLYQIRGRVGRSHRVAYAYLMYRPKKQLNETAVKRLKSIREFTQLGSGYKIAMRDLTIRGAGDLLGPQQAGFIDNVGIDMYMEMLHDAIARHRGLRVKEETTMKSVPLQVDAYIPKQFAPEDGDKLSLYQRIEKVKTSSALQALVEEVNDLYGRLPTEVRLLFEKKQLDILTNEVCVEDFKETARDLKIIFTKEWSSQIDGVRLFERMNQLSRSIALRYRDGRIILSIPKGKKQLELSVAALTESLQIGQSV